MKKPQIKIFFLFAIILYNTQLIAQQNFYKENISPEVEVFIFHTDRRCSSCKTMEVNTLKILKANFSKELKNGKIKYRVLNIDKKENKKYRDRYQLIGSALIIEGEIDGQLRYTNLTTEAFAYARFWETKFEKLVIANVKKYFK